MLDLIKFLIGLSLNEILLFNSLININFMSRQLCKMFF
jgi:hypothetical protein